MHYVKTIVINLCRLVLAFTFILSGFVKAVDPLGTQYKLQEYVAALGLSGHVPDWATLVGSVLIASFEFALGIHLLFAIRRRVASGLSLVFMAVMTAVMIWVVVASPVADCGCFGDAIVLTNGQSLAKNVVLLLCSAVIAARPLRMPRLISESNQWIVRNYSTLFVMAIAVMSLYHLPMFDFRPYHIGADIRKGMTVPPGAKQPEFTTTFVLEKDGKREEFTLENYPDSSWTFVDSRTVQVSEGYVPPIHDFSIDDPQTGEDLTDSVLSAPYVFLLVAPYLDKADDTNFGEIDRLYEYAHSSGVPFFCLTSSGPEAVERWRDITGAEYPFFNTDATTLKTMIRSNPGLMLLHRGVVARKWSHNALPTDEQLTASVEQLAQVPADYVPTKILKIFLWYVLPLLLLTLADRMLAWTRWVKRTRQNYKLYKIFNKKKTKMRKKIVAGNWKMNMNLQDGVALAKEINEVLAADKPNCGVVICTPFIHLASVAQVLNPEVVGLGAENCADKEKGAYTGEVSAEMVKSTGAQYVILGHSERRQYYGETAEILKEKVQLALKNGLKVIFCCGETLEEREAEKQNEVVKAELDGSVFNLTAEEWKNIILAYEPIWAIGTGKTATSDQAEEMLAYIRSIVAEKYGNEAAEDTTILYGGSCKASNAPELFSKPNIDGGLIGGASLKVADFKGIIDAWK